MTSLRSSFQPTLERDTIEFTRDETGPVFSQREGTMAAQVQWHFSGDFFENCNCSVVCPCLVSKAAPLTSRPTEGVCNLPLFFHIEKGSYGGVALDGLNVALVIHAPGPMAACNWGVS